MYGQLLNLLDRAKILRFSRENGGERYVKHFDAWQHLVIMLYAIIKRFDSLREITDSMFPEARKLAHLGIRLMPRRSTLSLQLCVGFQSTKPERPHAYQSKSAACLNNSYDVRPRSFSVSVAIAGCSMCQMKRSKSCPSKTGVSLISLAIMNRAFLNAKVQHLSHTTNILRRKIHFYVS